MSRKVADGGSSGPLTPPLSPPLPGHGGPGWRHVQLLQDADAAGADRGPETHGQGGADRGDHAARWGWAWPGAGWAWPGWAWPGASGFPLRMRPWGMQLPGSSFHLKTWGGGGSQMVFSSDPGTFLPTELDPAAGGPTNYFLGALGREQPHLQPPGLFPSPIRFPTLSCCLLLPLLSSFFTNSGVSSPRSAPLGFELQWPCPQAPCLSHTRPSC